jgi:hypothetical protein
VLTVDEARRIATNIAKLPNFLMAQLLNDLSAPNRFRNLQDVWCSGVGRARRLLAQKGKSPLSALGARA